MISLLVLVVTFPTLIQGYEIGVGYNNMTILNNPAYIHARKMSQLLKNQDVVATCRYMLFKTFKTFYEAEAACLAMGGNWELTTVGNVTLADIYDYEENVDITSLMHIAWGPQYLGTKYDRRNWAWINLRKIKNNDVVLDRSQTGKNWNPEDWSWGNGSTPVWHRWMRNMPDQATKKMKIDGINTRIYQNYAMISRKGVWDDTYYNMEAPYVCNYCGKYIVVAEHVKWWKAKQLCKSYGLTMAMINSAQDNAELRGAINATLGTVIDSPRFNNTNWVWIGVEEVMNSTGYGTNEWINIDNTTLGWEPTWDRKYQPDNWVIGSREQRVVAISRKDGKWDDSFVHKKRPFACMCPWRSCAYS